MQDHSKGTGLEAAAKRLDHTAKDLRKRTGELLSRKESPDDDAEGAGSAEFTADILAALADSLEAMAEGARASGMALRDRGRDAARAIHRGERVLREGGYVEGAVRATSMARRNLRALALTGAGVVAAVVLYRKLTRDS